MATIFGRSPVFPQMPSLYSQIPHWPCSYLSSVFFSHEVILGLSWLCISNVTVSYSKDIFTWVYLIMFHDYTKFMCAEENTIERGIVSLSVHHISGYRLLLFLITGDIHTDHMVMRLHVRCCPCKTTSVHVLIDKCLAVVYWNYLHILCLFKILPTHFIIDQWILLPMLPAVVSVYGDF